MLSWPGGSRGGFRCCFILCDLVCVWPLWGLVNRWSHPVCTVAQCERGDHPHCSDGVIEVQRGEGTDQICKLPAQDSLGFSWFLPQKITSISYNR